MKIRWQQNACQLLHDKEMLPNTINFALPLANKRRLRPLGFLYDAQVCKAGGPGRYIYTHHEWNPDQYRFTLEAVAYKSINSFDPLLQLHKPN